jgi:hypothetical protein
VAKESLVLQKEHEGERLPGYALVRPPAPTCGSDRPQWIRALSTSGIIERVDELLEVTYRSGDLGNISDVLSETVYILLSLNTHEVVYQRVYRELKDRFPHWVDVERAPMSELRALLKPGGLHDQRARYLWSREVANLIMTPFRLSYPRRCASVFTLTSSTMVEQFALVRSQSVGSAF